MALDPLFVQTEREKIPQIEVSGILSKSDIIKDGNCIDTYTSAIDTGIEKIDFEYYVYSSMPSDCVTDSIYSIYSYPFVEGTNMEMILTQENPHLLLSENIVYDPTTPSSASMFLNFSFYAIFLLLGVIISLILFYIKNKFVFFKEINKFWIIISTIIIAFLLLVSGFYLWEKFSPGNEIGQQNNLVSENKYTEDKDSIKSDELNELQNKDTTLIKEKEDNNSVYYTGSITVSGIYKETDPENFLGGNLCFYADDETGYLIPRDPNLWGEGLGDRRNPWFCFNNQDIVKTLFDIDDSLVFNDQTVECIQGEATVTVSNYKVNKMESSVFDTADLEKIILKDEFIIKCE